MIATVASPASAARSRTMLVSFLGAIVRRLGNWMPIAGTVDLITPLGLDAPSVRTAVSRLKKRGWLDSEARAGQRGYVLTEPALQALAAGDDVVWHARQPADLADGWCIVNASVPETARGARHQLRAHLAALGFGNISTALWIAPARMRGAAERAITELEASRHCAVFVGDHVAGRDLGEMLQQSWDLEAVDRGYRAFLGRYEPELARLSSTALVDPREAFTAYLAMIDRWRRLPFRDPGLPRELLGGDWSAPAAGALFEQLVSLLEGRALAHA
ncbi:MAG: PaaX family transcriptional regulator, partial [Solirubrobacteraceae bacterium]